MTCCRRPRSAAAKTAASLPRRTMRPCCLLLTVLAFQDVLSKVFQRCELVHELSKKKHRILEHDVGTWVCIARHESQFNTSAIGHLNADLSGDHGLFQISDQYWCSPPGVGMACGLNCDQLEDDDITDDVICARRIYRAHKRRTGDGFTAWAVYGRHCRGNNSAYSQGCEDWNTTTTTTPKPTPTTPSDILSTSEPSTEEDQALSSTTEYGLEDRYHNQDVTSTNTDLTAEEPVSKSRARQSHSRLSETSFPLNQKPRFSFSDLDPKTAWFAIHYDPRFLDESK